MPSTHTSALPRRKARRRVVNPRRLGFTLVEMLVVITIIGILAAILIPTIGSTMRSARLSTIAIEVSNLSNALENYRRDNQDYPPDFTNLQAVASHLRKAYPRMNVQVKPGLSFIQWLNSAPPNQNMPDPRQLDAAEALYFWMASVNKNKRAPFAWVVNRTLADPQSPGEITYFEGETTDIDGDGWLEWVSKHAQGVPYVYFDGRVMNDTEVNQSGQCTQSNRPPVCAYAWAVYPQAGGTVCVGRESPIPFHVDPPAIGVVRPYRTETRAGQTENTTYPNLQDADTGINNTTWIDSGKFQIIAPGLDQSFGDDFRDGDRVIFKTFPTPNYRRPASDFTLDADNLGSFSDSKTIDAAQP